LRSLKDERQNLKGRDQSKEDGIGGTEYDTGNKFAGSNKYLDLPGLELFYKKGVFTRKMDENFNGEPHV